MKTQSAGRRIKQSKAIEDPPPAAGRDPLHVIELEEQLDRQLQSPRVGDPVLAHAAATAWSNAVWAAAVDAGPLILTAREVEHAFTVAQRPVFVLGAHRSGTTLVRDLLDHHPALSVLPAEGTMYTNFAWHLRRLAQGDWQRFLGCEWLRRLANPINQRPYWLLGRSSGEGSPYVGFARALMAWWPQAEARLGPRITAWPLVAIAFAYAHCTAGFRAVCPLQRWVEKTPANERFLPRLLAEFPDARFIHVIRDPCAVYASHQRSARNSGRCLGEANRVLHQMQRSYREAAKRSVRPIPDSYLLLRYEDLLGDPAGSVRRVACFLGIQMLPILMQPTANGIPTPSNSSRGSDAVAGRLNRRPADDAFDVLTLRERERLSAMVAGPAGVLGYRLLPLPVLRRNLLRMQVNAEWLVERIKARWTRLLASRTAGTRPPAPIHGAPQGRGPGNAKPSAVERVSAGLLGDTPQRDYAEKLRLFNAFARPELRDAIDALSLRTGSRVLDAGCGTGEAVGWFQETLRDPGMVVGIDLAAAHVRIARGTNPMRTSIVQGDMLTPPFADGSFDLVWAVNAVNHLRDPVAGVRSLSNLLRPGGRIVVGQSSLVPDMYFAWDARLEKCVNEAVRAHYRERYGRSERELAAVRSLAGWLQRAGLRDVSVRTRMIERTQPLVAADERYLLECIFRGTWGERLHKYMDARDFEELSRLCSPDDSGYALRRPDFHFMQSLTIAVGTR